MLPALWMIAATMKSLGNSSKFVEGWTTYNPTFTGIQELMGGLGRFWHGSQTVDTFETQLLVITLIWLVANIWAWVWAYQDLQFFYRNNVDGLTRVRGWRRLIFLTQAFIAQVWLLGGAIRILKLPPGDLQAEIKNVIMIGLTTQLGLKAFVDILFVIYINKYPIKTLGRRINDGRGKPQV